MTQWPTTRDTLLVKLASEKYEDAWFEFAQVYEPAIYRFARKRGIQHDDAIELTQRVMFAVMRQAKDWSKNEPPDHFRSWLKRIANNSLINMVKRESKHRGLGGEDIAVYADNDSCGKPSTEESESQAWATEENRAIMRQAIGNVKPEFSSDSWSAFEETLLNGCSVESTARTLGKTAGAVYAARSRIVRRITSESKRLTDAEISERQA